MASLNQIRVPAKAVPLLKRLAEFGGVGTEALVAALSTGQVRDQSALEAAVKSVVGDTWTFEEVVDLVGNLIAMSTLRTSHGFSAEALAEALIKHAGDSFNEAESEDLPNRLAALLDAPDLLAYSKAADIYTEFDRLLHHSRVVTDIRPVFDTGPKPDPLGAVIVHTLRLDYFDGGRLQTISFGLNGNDLEELRKAVERAEQKENRLSTVLDTAGLVEFDIAGDANV